MRWLRLLRAFLPWLMIVAIVGLLLLLVFDPSWAPAAGWILFGLIVIWAYGVVYSDRRLRVLEERQQQADHAS